MSPKQRPLLLLLNLSFQLGYALREELETMTEGKECVPHELPCPPPPASPSSRALSALPSQRPCASCPWRRLRRPGIAWSKDTSKSTAYAKGTHHLVHLGHHCALRVVAPLALAEDGSEFRENLRQIGAVALRHLEAVRQAVEDKAEPHAEVRDYCVAVCENQLLQVSLELVWRGACCLDRSTSAGSALLIRLLCSGSKARFRGDLTTSHAQN